MARSPRHKPQSPHHRTRCRRNLEPITTQAGRARIPVGGARLGTSRAQRIVGHNVADPRSRVFDILRTQVLQAMDQKNWQFLAVTSPTEGCGKTVTAINLAFSIARQPERSALLIDMDLQRPSVANYLGIKCRLGVQDILEQRATLADPIIRADAESCKLLALPATAPTRALLRIDRLSQLGHDVAGY